MTDCGVLIGVFVPLVCSDVLVFGHSPDVYTGL